MLNMRSQITSTLRSHNKAPFLLLLACLLIFSLSASPINAQDSLEGVPQSAFYNNEIIIRYKDGFTPEEIAQKVAVREKRAETLGGSLQNTQENISLLLTGEDRPEKVQENLSSVIEEHILEEVTAENLESSTRIYTITSDSSMDQVIHDAKTLPVEHVQPNYSYYLLDVPNDRYFTNQWGFTAIQTDKAWGRTKGSTSLRVAIIDSGIDKNHPDLAGHVEKSKPIMQGCFNNGDSNGHGTHVAGVIGAMTNNTEGIAGINWDVTLLGYCVVAPNGTGSSTAVAQGIRNAVDDGAKVINMSLGGPAFPNQDLELTNALEYAASKDVVIVAAAGNCGKYPPGEYTDSSMAQCYWGGNADKYLPASSPHAISVAGTGPQNERAAYSNYGSTVDIAAPGGNPSGGSSTCLSNGSNCIVSTWSRTTSCPTTGFGSGYCAIAGTSMAAPHVTGLAALIRAAKPSLNRAEVQALLQDTALDLGTSGRDDGFAYGLIDAQKSIESIAAASTTPTPVTSPIPSISATPTPGQCPDKKITGDYNCDGTIALSDFESWRQDFEKSITTLSDFEHFRRGFTQK